MTRAGDLHRNIIEKLEFEPGLDASNIAVSVKDSGVVILAGEVKSYAEKLIAEKVLQKIPGVNGIAEELKINLAAEYIRSDAEIAKHALNALECDLLIPHEKIKFIVESGRLTLTGQVEQYYQKMRAQKALENLAGITALINNIIINSDIEALGIKEKITKEFERNARIGINNIEVKVEGNIVTLKGVARSFDEDKEARMIAWSVPGVVNVIDQMMISWRR